MTELSYADMLSGDYVPMTGVGHFRSPQLKEMMPTCGIGWQTYNLHIYLLKASASDIAEFFGIAEENQTLFHIVVNNESIRELYRMALGFFMLETVVFSEDHGCFIVVSATPNEDGETSLSIVGSIDEDNFDDVREVILRMNYISLKRSDVNTKFSSAAAEEAWKKIQEYQRKTVRSEDDDTTNTIGNYMSKLCAIHPTYNMLNIQELTIFQFYDAFFQSAYLKSIAFSEAIVSNHGSDSFNFNDWMNPVQQ